MILKHADLPALRKRYRDRKIVVGSGVFDMLHIGHVAYLQSLKKYGDVVVVVVKPDARVKKFKHPSRPVVPEEDRARVVDSIKDVDYVIVGSHNTSRETDAMYKKIFELLKPDVYVTSNEVWGKLQEITDAKVHVLQRQKVGHSESTTSIIEHIRKTDLL